MAESSDLIGVALIGVLVYAIYQQRSQNQLEVVTNWPTQTQQPITTQSPVPIINPASPVMANGAPCSYGPPCNPGQACSMMAIAGTWNNGQCVPATVTLPYLVGCPAGQTIGTSITGQQTCMPVGAMS